MPKNILVTGASGFVGSHFIDYLIKYNINYSVFSERILSNYRLSDYGRVDVIVHLAGLAHNKARSDGEIYNVNTQGTIELAKKAKMNGVKRFVFMSSVAVYGTDTQSPITEDTQLSPITSFAKSKYEAELGLLSLSDKNFEVVIIRTPLVYGRYAPANFNLLLKLVSKLPVLPFGLTNNRRSYIAAANLSDFILVCVNHLKAAGEIFLVSDEYAISTEEFTNAISEGLDKKSCQLPIPVWLMYIVAKLVGKTETAKQLLASFELDRSKAERVLNWTPPLSMAQAMKLLKK